MGTATESTKDNLSGQNATPSITAAGGKDGVPGKANTGSKEDVG